MARDRFTAQLACPGCCRTGEAHLLEADRFAYSYGNLKTTVESVSEGFKVIEQPSDIGTVDLYCADCDLSALARGHG
jgi:hypothetical protein